MSDESIWGPPTAGPAPVPVPVEPSSPPPHRSRGPIIAVVVGAVALIGAGVFAASQVFLDDSAGGADSPEAAGLALLDALDQEDALGAIDLLLPGERETLRQPLTELVDELTRIEVLSDDASLTKISGLDVQIGDGSVDVEPTNVDDIVNLKISAMATATVDGEALPIGELVRDVAEGEPSELDVAASEPHPLDMGITAVREDDRWYLSAGYTLAESARAEMGEDIPETGVAPVGGDSPEDAMDNLLEGLVALDLTRLIAALNPNEFQALQRYAPLFLTDAQTALDEAGVSLTAEDAEYTVSGDGDQRLVAIDRLHIAFSSADGDGTVTLDDGCWKVEAGGESLDSCDPADMAVVEGDFEGSETIEDLAASLEAAFADVEQFGFAVQRVDGEWYFSPIATMTDSMLTMLRALSREEIEDLQVKIEDAVDVLFGSGASFDAEELVEDYSMPGDDETTDTGGGISDPTNECFAESESGDAADCFQALVEEGSIEAQDVPLYLRFPECGLAELWWSGDYFSMSDDDFVAAATDAAPCFEALVTAGELEDWELPIELAAPECLDGRNFYNVDDDEYFQAVSECANG